MNLKEWLESHGAHDAKRCLVYIDGEAWESCLYKRTLEYTEGMDAIRWGKAKAGDKYTETMVYCVGKLPKCKFNKQGRIKHDAKVCFPNPYDGLDWYVAGYAQEIKPEHDCYNPFGKNFLLRPWDLPEKIDAHEPKPYTRIPIRITLND